MDYNNIETVEQLKQLYDNLQEKLEEKKPQYLQLMQQYFSLYLLEPFARYKAKYGDKDMSDDELKTLFNIEKHSSDDILADYVNCTGNCDFSIFSRLKYHLAKNDKEKELAKIISENDINILYSFSQLYNCIRTLAYVFDDNIEDYKRIRQDYYINSKPLVFNNEDILITDPCYVTEGDDWEKSEYGEDFNIFGVKKYVSKSTLYGDWSCTTYNTDTKVAIGEFCADAGMVSIFSLDEIKERVNPNIEDWIKEHKWCATVIRNFTGTAQIKTGVDDNYTFYRYIEGKGSINFIGQQTGL